MSMLLFVKNGARCMWDVKRAKYTLKVFNMLRRLDLWKKLPCGQLRSIVDYVKRMERDGI